MLKFKKDEKVKFHLNNIKVGEQKCFLKIKRQIFQHPAATSKFSLHGGTKRTS